MSILKNKKFKEEKYEKEKSALTTIFVNNDSVGHSHSHIEVKSEGGKKTVAPVAWILLIGDAIHNCVDGLSIGAAFTENTFLGISVALACVCEELPHELGKLNARQISSIIDN